MRASDSSDFGLRAQVSVTCPPGEPAPGGLRLVPGEGSLVPSPVGNRYGIRYRERDGIVVDVHLTQSELATMCGAAEITLQKALRELRTAGVVDTGYRQVIVRDAAAMRLCADRT